MSRAEVLRIIDVLPEPEQESDSVGSSDGREQTASGGDEIALWESPAENTAMVTGMPPEPVIALEYVNLPDDLDARLVMLREPASATARSYRLLRHRLLSHATRVVAVTSARPGDGKTTCAANLALAIAEDAMTHVLLIDTNLRRPALGTMFGFDPTESFVADVTRFTDVVPPYRVAGIRGTRVHVAGLPGALAPEARLERTLFSAVLAELRSAYDYIIIDAASVLESADADVVGECADGVVVTVRAGSSFKSDVGRAIEQLRPAIVLGTALLDV